MRARTWLLCSTLIGCRGTADEPRDRERPHATSAPLPAPVEAHVVEAHRALMSTPMSMTLVSTDDTSAQRAADRAFDTIEALERALSEWLPSSSVSQVNAAAGDAPVVVDAATMTVLAEGRSLAEATDGAYDLTWAAMRGLYLFQRDSHRVPTDDEIAARLPLVGYRGLVLDPAASTAFLRRPGMAIGTGSIAKGFALDEAERVLTEAGIAGFMIFGGGQVHTHGRRGSRPWRVGIQHPRRSGSVASLEVEDASISTSGDYEHAFLDDEGRRWHHIIDLRTGRPSTAAMQVTLVTRRGIHADALSTACFVMGPARCLGFLETLPYEAGAVIIDSDLRVHVSARLAPRLRWSVELRDGRLPLVD